MIAVCGRVIPRFRTQPLAQMKNLILAPALLLGNLTASAQITIELDDLQLAPGTQRSYLTHQAGLAIVTGLIQGVGGPFHWDFSAGVDDEIYRYEILPTNESPFSDSFAGAELAEFLTVDSDGRTGWTFLNLTPRGRELHGFHDSSGPAVDPLTKFDTPLADLPASFTFLDQWSEQASYRQSFDIGEGLILPVDTEVTITSIVDAHGTLTLPTLGTVGVVRVNELSLIDSVVDADGTPIPLEQSFVRSYLWFSKEYGLVAQITFDSNDEFEVAKRFLRLSQFTPGLADPVIRSVKYDANASAVTIISSSVVGERYVLEVSRNLREWLGKGDPVRATGTTLNLVDAFLPSPRGNLYYRVRRLTPD